jgi:hypothetical protein
MAFVAGGALPAQQPPAAPEAAQTASDEYTLYELLQPGTARFRILYDVTATTPGARYFFNPIRRGSEASNEAVFDRMTGEPLRFTEIDGATARQDGFAAAALDTRYIRVELGRPVPENGEVRIRIDKTYRDPVSYRVEGRDLVFERSLGIRRNAVVLPAGYELVALNVPSQVMTDPDGRIRISFINPGPGPAPLVLRARRLSP